MAEKSEKIDWKKRLEAMKHGHSGKPPQPVAAPHEPPAPELPAGESVPLKPPEPEPEAVQEVKPEGRTVKPVGVLKEPSAPVPDLQAGRVDSLERQLRSVKLMGMLAAILAMIALLGVAFVLKRAPGHDAGMSATNLTINDVKGLGRAWIGERHGQVQVELRDQAGRRRLGLGLTAAGEPRLTFYDKAQKILSAIVPLPDGQPGIKLLNQAGEVVAALPPPSPSVPNPPPAAAPEPQAPASLPTPMPQPGKVPPEAPKVEPKSGTKPEAAVKAAESVIFVANPGGKSYHLPSSPWVKNTPSNQLLKFSSAAEAAKAGLHPGRDIRPDLPH